MRLATKHFGEIEIEEKGIINFQEGLPGFDNARKFVLLGSSSENSLFKWLQSVDLPELAFAVVDPFLVKKDYDIHIRDSDLQRIGAERMEDIQVYSIVVVPEDILKVSINLKAPVIINTKNKNGAQIVLDTDKYGVRHYILEELQGQEDIDNACTHKEEGPIYCSK